MGKEHIQPPDLGPPPYLAAKRVSPMRLAPVTGLEADVDWISTDSVAFQFDGNDLVHVLDVDPDTGDARILVFSSTHPDADVIFHGTVNVLERAGTPDDDDDETED